MAYTEVTNIAVVYDLKEDGAQWNNGNVKWNIVGNVETVEWNLTTPAYSEQSPSSVTWVEV